MLALDDPGWHTLSHAYGAAENIPALLKRAVTDPGPGHNQKSAWFDLWSALCHQGDVYTASYAAVPHLIAIARSRSQRQQYDPLLLAASIELARLAGTGPAIPASLAPSYKAAVEEGRALAERAVAEAWDDDSSAAFRGSAAALGGRVDEARSILDADERAV